jgi:cation diffusion facilitator CzcD-associated flavoprotein CzcO
MDEAIDLPSELDVIIIGAGISGLNAAYRIQNELPHHTYSILEARNSIGGTWDLFRYPGVRSDTDLHNFGFPWQPWVEKRLLADGPSILKYIKKSAAKENIDGKIRFCHKVLSAKWSTAEQTWSLEVAVNEETLQLHAKALVIGCGYYDYDTPLTANIRGLKNFEGKVVHPQFWPTKLDYEGKKVVIVGSGATAVTLLPSLTDKAAHVTMLQRSPTYIMPLPNAGNSWLDWVLPRSVVFKIVRLQLAIMPILMYSYCRWFPKSARRILRSEAVKYLGKDYPVDQHFKPVYDPWDQRLCFAPDGDFYKSIRAGKASVATGQIENVGPKSITLYSGDELPADIIVTATGLKLGIAGGARFFVDGAPIDLAEKVLWRNSWLQDVPNCAFVLGYTNASWTLGADTTAILFCRMLKAMRSQHFTSAVPRITMNGMKTKPYFDIKSTYAQQGAKELPMTGDVGPWRGRTNYFLDSWRAAFGNIEEDLEYYKGPVMVRRD